MWMEGQVYPDVIDRINYLGRSALARPGVPLDTGAGGFEYGAWLFWRFLTEKVFSGDPTIIREIWERADGGPSPAYGDLYSFQAVRSALASHGLAFRSTFAQFGWTNDLRDYEEADFGYPVAPLAARFNFGPSLHSTGWQAPRLAHLSTRFYRFRPQAVGPAAKLHLRVDLPWAGDEPRGNCDRLREGRPEGDPPDRARPPRRRPRDRRVRELGGLEGRPRPLEREPPLRLRAEGLPEHRLLLRRVPEGRRPQRTASAPAWAKRR